MPAHYLSPVTCYLLPVTCHLLLVTCYLLPVTCYLLLLILYVLPAQHLVPLRRQRKLRRRTVEQVRVVGDVARRVAGVVGPGEGVAEVDGDGTVDVDGRAHVARAAGRPVAGPPHPPVLGDERGVHVEDVVARQAN